MRGGKGGALSARTMRPAMHACSKHQLHIDHEEHNMDELSLLDRRHATCDYYTCFEDDEQAASAQMAQQPLDCSSPTLSLLQTPPPIPPLPPPPPMPLPPPPPIEPEGENPRVIRKIAEKQRRDNLNQSVARLASIVPPVVHSDRKLNKTSVLKLAAHYLRSHQYVFGNSNTEEGPKFSSNFTSTLLGSLKGFLITVTFKGIFVVVSPNIKQYLGYTEFDLLGQSIFDIVHKGDHEILREQLYPRSCTLTPKGQLVIPNEIDAEEKITDALSKERRNFVIRFQKNNQRRSSSPQYLTCQVEGSLRKSDRAGTKFEQTKQMGRRRARARGENPYASGNDIVFVGMVRPSTDTFTMESILESFRMEYRTRHSIDGEIIQCEQRIALVTGYLTNEVNGVNAMNFMHRDDVRWVIVALREMYEQHRLVGESCYRLMTKNGKFIYMRTFGWLDVDKDSKAVTSFVCTNTMISEKEGKHLISVMKKKFSLMINNTEELHEQIKGNNEDSDKNMPSIEDPQKLEQVILHLVTDLPMPKPENVTEDNTLENAINSPMHLSIIPPKPDQIHKAIKKSYNVLKSCYIKVNRDRYSDEESESVTNQPTIQMPLQMPQQVFNNPIVENAPNTTVMPVLFSNFANDFTPNFPSYSHSYSWSDSYTTNNMQYTLPVTPTIPSTCYYGQNAQNNYNENFNLVEPPVSNCSNCSMGSHVSRYVDYTQNPAIFSNFNPMELQTTTVPNWEYSNSNEFNNIPLIQNNNITNCTYSMPADTSYEYQNNDNNVTFNYNENTWPMGLDSSNNYQNLNYNNVTPYETMSNLSGYTNTYAANENMFEEMINQTYYNPPIDLSCQYNTIPEKPQITQLVNEDFIEASAYVQKYFERKGHNTPEEHWMYTNTASNNSGVKRLNHNLSKKDKSKKIKAEKKKISKEINEMIERELIRNNYLEKTPSSPYDGLLTLMEQDDNGKDRFEEILKEIECKDGIDSRNFNETYNSQFSCSEGTTSSDDDPESDPYDFNDEINEDT